MGLFDRRIRLGQRRGDGGYAMVSVVGFGAAMVIGVGAVGAYALQNMNSAGRSQGFGAAIQAAQAGVDDFVAQLSVDPDYAESPVTDWQPVVGSEDGAGRACVGTDATLPPNCPRFRHSAAATPTGYIVTSVGKARGLERAVQVRVKARALTDYLYFSEVEAADPADGWAYPPLLGGAPVGCENPAWGSDPRPPAGCVVPPWRGGDATDGSRVHTDDVFTVAGAPSFNSRVTAAIEACRTDVAACVDEAGGAAPAYHDGPPAYADDLTMPANGLTTIAAHAASGGCTYYGPTRISFEGEQMRVWSPQTPPSASCGGGIDADVLNAPVDVVVTAANQAGLCTALGAVTGLLCNLLAPVGSTVELPVSELAGGLLSGSELVEALAGVVAPGDLVDIPANGAIYVADNAPGGSPAPDPSAVQCLLGAALGLYSTADATLTAGLLNPNGTIGSNCTGAKLFVDGQLDGVATAGVDGAILIVSDLTYTSSDAAEDDRLGLVASGPVEVYNWIQCVLATGTCLSLEPLELTGKLTAITAILNGSGNIAELLEELPGYGDRRVQAAIVSLGSRFGLQLPALSAGLAASVIDQLVELDIEAPTLTLTGSLAQRFRGLIGADLIDLNLGVPALELASADLDIGYDAHYVYDRNLRTDPPPFLPALDRVIWDPQSFAEVDVRDVL